MVEDKHGGLVAGGRSVVDVEGLGWMLGVGDVEVLGEVLGPGYRAGSRTAN